MFQIEAAVMMAVQGFLCSYGNTGDLGLSLSAAAFAGMAPLLGLLR